MAVWQWDLWLVPKARILERFESIPQYLDEKWFESLDWWNGYEVRIEPLLDSFLPRLSESAWGAADGTVVRLSGENDGAEIFIRLDLHQPDPDFIRSLVDFAKENSLVFFTLESNLFIEPELQKFLCEARKSRAFRFLDDPEGFFRDYNYMNKINDEIRDSNE